jgi:hypothetical protein
MRQKSPLSRPWPSSSLVNPYKSSLGMSIAMEAGLVKRSISGSTVFPFTPRSSITRTQTHQEGTVLVLLAFALDTDRRQNVNVFATRVDVVRASRHVQVLQEALVLNQILDWKSNVISTYLNEADTQRASARIGGRSFEFFLRSQQPLQPLRKRDRKGNITDVKGKASSKLVRTK